jgi:hypothetical protein
MSQWVLVCPRCKEKFAHRQIDDKSVEEAFRTSFGLVARPQLPVDILTCPSCNARSWYHQFDLIYSDDPDKGAKGEGT